MVRPRGRDAPDSVVFADGMKPKLAGNVLA
jgi:hypothetical protein